MRREKSGESRREFLTSAAVAGAAAVVGTAPVMGTVAAKGEAASTTAEPAYEVGAYYFPNYHVDPINERQEKLGPNWTEWKLTEVATPRFPGHRQPRIPLWGPTNEADPRVMEMKIDAAADYGLTYWIFDWYYYDEGPFLNRCLEEGFLKARNNDRLKFCSMWANHDWNDIFPYHRGDPQPLLHPGRVTPETFEKIMDVQIGYFRHPSHFTIDNCPYFSIYDLTKFLAIWGSVEETRRAMDEFRRRVRAAGFPDLHLNAVVWGQPVLPVEQTPADPRGILDGVGFDSVTSYVWIHHVPLNEQLTPFDWVRDQYFGYWDKTWELYGRPYYPNVSVGWDSSPRTVQSDEFGNWGYPFTNLIDGGTPERFREALRLTKERMEADPRNPRILNINSWNEWTEGSYLEPDTETKYGYLEAIRDVFGARHTKPT